MDSALLIGRQETSWDECMKILEDLPVMVLSERAEAVGILLRNPSPGIRQRALHIGAAVLHDEQLVSYLRDDSDDVIRNAGLEILKLKGIRSFSHVIDLLNDGDEDVVLQAILLLDHFRDPRAFNALLNFLKHKNPNIVQATISAIGHLGDARVVSELLPFLEADSWLQMAAINALGDIRSPAAIKPLKKLLTDFMLGPLAAEAIARIGGVRSFDALASHWIKFNKELEAESMLGLLAYVLEGRSKNPRVSPEFLKTISPYLIESAETSYVAARCILALGPSESDREAVYILEKSQPDSSELPVCLLRRRDLISELLRMKGLPCIWGLQLAVLFPRDTSVSDIALALSGEEVLTHVNTVIKSLQKIRNPLLAKPIFKLYVRLSAATRPLIIPALRLYKNDLQGILKLWVGLDKETSIVLSSYLGGDPRKVVLKIRKLPFNDQIFVLSQISRNKSICKHLPWSEWLEEGPYAYGPIAAQCAVDAKLRELVPLLRGVLKKTALHEIIRALGKLQDRESVPILANYMKQADSLTKAIVIESLGNIGGPEARKTLHGIIENSEGKEVGLAYRALSRCAVEDDTLTFRKVVTYPDWLVRLACVEVLGRFPNTDNLDALTKLTSDSVSLVAQRAMTFIEA
jgi:HEAT repeat protein